MQKRLPEYSRRKLVLGWAAALEDALRDPARGVVVAHKNADPDAFGAAILVYEVLRAYGVESCILFPEGLSAASKQVRERAGIEYRDCRTSELPELLVAVDTSNPVQLGGARSLLGEAEKIVVIDHHVGGRLHSLATLSIVDPGAASSSEIIAVIMDVLGIKPSPAAATAGLAGIYSDTRRFQSPGIYSFQAASFLLASGANPGAFLAQKRPEFSERYAKILAASRARVARVCREYIVVFTHIGSFESKAAKALIDLGADVAVAVKEEPGDRFRVSIRVSQEALEAGMAANRIAEYIAERYNGEGGGHPRAAMASIPVNPAVAASPEEMAEALYNSLPGKLARMCVEARRSGGGGEEDSSLR